MTRAPTVKEATGDRVTWTYDGVYQLLREKRSGVNSYYVTHTYDAVGNRRVKDTGTRTTFSYDAANRLKYSTDGARTTFTHDANGNQTRELKPSGDITTMTWDYENRNKAVILPSLDRVTCTYDGLGHRVKRETDAETRKFIYDGENILHVTDESDLTQSVFTLDPRQYGLLISQRQNDGGWLTLYHHFDALGSTDSLTDGSQVVTDTYTYYAFGELKTSTGTTENPYTWVAEVGYWKDIDIDRFHLNARPYEPEQARFLSKDPLGLLPDYNPYRYVRNDALNATDPTGLGSGQFATTSNSLAEEAELRRIRGENPTASPGAKIEAAARQDREHEAVLKELEAEIAKSRAEIQRYWADVHYAERRKWLQKMDYDKFWYAHAAFTGDPNGAVEFVREIRELMGFSDAESWTPSKNSVNKLQGYFMQREFVAEQDEKAETARIKKAQSDANLKEGVRKLKEQEAKEREKYWNDALLQIFVGDYSEADPNAAGIVGSVALGLTGFDVYKDVADVAYGFQHWEWSWKHAGSQGLNLAGMLPIVGIVKNVKQVKKIEKGVEGAAEIVEEAKHGAKIASSIGAKTWQEYEAGVRRLYGEASFTARQYTAIVDGKLVNGIADNITEIGGKRVAVEAKFVMSCLR